MVRILKRTGLSLITVASLVFAYATPSLARVDVETVLASNLTAAQTQALLELFRGAYAAQCKQEVYLVPTATPAPPAAHVPPAPPPAVPTVGAQGGAIPQTPSQPAPSQPAPSQPVPTQPAPAEPAPTQPAPAEPAPTQSTPSQPAVAPSSYTLAPAPSYPIASHHSPPAGPPEERIELSFVALAARVQVRALRYNAQGKLVHSVRTMLAGLDEAPEVLGRMAEALYALKSYEETATLDNITSEERRPPRRRNTEFLGGIRTSITIPYAPNQKLDGFGTFGFDGRLEADQYFVEFGAGGAIPVFTNDDSTTWNMGGVYADLGFSAYLMKTAIAPYGGLGMQPRIWITNGGGGVTLLPYLQAGVMFLRDHSTRFYTEFRSGYNVVPIGRNESDDAVRPFEFAWAAGIGF